MQLFSNKFGFSGSLALMLPALLTLITTLFVINTHISPIILFSISAVALFITLYISLTLWAIVYNLINRVFFGNTEPDGKIAPLPFGISGAIVPITFYIVSNSILLLVNQIYPQALPNIVLFMNFTNITVMLVVSLLGVILVKGLWAFLYNLLMNLYYRKSYTTYTILPFAFALTGALITAGVFSIITLSSKHTSPELLAPIAVVFVLAYIVLWIWARIYNTTVPE